MTRFGISPAFVFSRHSTRFTADDFCGALSVAHRLGFSGYQPEIYFADQLPAWENGGAGRVDATARDLGLTASQFVAHFLMDGFTTPAGLADRTDLDSLRRVADVARHFDGCRVLTVALGRMQLPPEFPADAGTFNDLRRRFVEKIHTYLQVAVTADLELALEILPGSFVGNAEGFLRLADEIGSRRLGINLDTGHAWAAREIMELLPAKLAGRVFGVHLKDNNSDQNLALAPGKGTIPWRPFLRGLPASGYTGSLDLEIVCAPADVEAEYAAGLAYLRSLDPG
jgi:sugar phosphate isomerase/epimerase